jgi:F-box/leucine-rich repeat protein 2/20
VRKLPLIEEVYISISCLTKDSLEALGRSCPHLKSLEFVREGPGFSVLVGFDDNDALVISETMSRLRRLDINQNRITDIGLLSILDGCPLLEYLNLQGSLKLDLSETLKKRCLEQIKDLRLDNYYYDDIVSYHDSLSDEYSSSDVDSYHTYDYSESGGLSDDEILRLLSLV